MISTEDRLELVEKSLAKQKRATLILGCFLVAAISWGGAAEVKRAEMMSITSWPSSLSVTPGMSNNVLKVKVVDGLGRPVDFSK